MGANAGLIDLVANGGLTEIPREIVLGVEGLTEEFGDFPFQEFNDVPDFVTSATATNPLFDFGVAIINAAGAEFESFIDDVAAVTAAALEQWAQFIVGADGADIQVAVTINPALGAGTVASATAGSFFIGPESEDGFIEVFTSAQLELQTGVDLNGDTPDIVINVNPQFLLGASFDTDPAREATPGVIDFVSVLLHEINHSLGFLSFRDNTGTDFELDIDGDGELETLESTYGSFVNFDVVDGFLTPTFNGASVLDVYGEPVILESTTGSSGSDISHFALFNPDGSLADTALALENPSVIPGDIVEIGVLELAVLQDLGYTVNIPDNATLVNQFDPLPFTPTVSVNQQLTANGDTVLLTIELDSPSLFVSVPTSVGVTVTAPDGTEQTVRARFGPGETTAVVELDADTFFTTSGTGARTVVTGDVDVTVFFPAQAQLANGEQSETVTVSANLITGTTGDDNLTGGNGQDQLFGGDGDDLIDGSNDNDLVNGGNGNDTLLGGNANDTVLGGNGADNIDGGNGNDVLLGGADNDTIGGLNGTDTIGGGAGDDNITGNNSNDVLSGGDGNDTVDGGNGEDIAFGDAGDDLIIGGNGFDTLDGGAGNDVLNGDNGSDILIAGAGSDTLTGGNSFDDFVFSFGNAGDADTITDFSRGDELVLDGFGDFASADDVLAAAEQVGADVVITLDAATNQTLTLQGFDLGDLNANAISFGATLPPAFSTFISNDLLGAL